MKVSGTKRHDISDSVCLKKKENMNSSQSKNYCRKGSKDEEIYYCNKI